MKRIIYGTLSYFVFTFALGASWHFYFFKSLYHALGVYNRQEPIILFGMMAMLLQGIVLSFLFQYFYKGNSPIKEGLLFSWAMGLFMFTVSTIAFAAKSEVTSMSSWFVIQAAFHIIQFTGTGILLGIVFGRSAFSRGYANRIHGI